MAMWDAIVSILRMYSEEELIELTFAIDTDFQWKFQEIPIGWGNSISVFTGNPPEVTMVA